MHIKNLRAYTTVLTLLAGCVNAPLLAAELASATLTVDGLERQYLVHTPNSNQAPRPLLLMLHGHGGSAAQLLGHSTGGRARAAPFKPWLQIAADNNAVLMAADGAVGPDGKSGWNDLRGVAGNPATDDVGFLRALITHGVAQYGANPDRVYIVGISNGGHMAFRVALQAPELVAGIGVVAAAMPANYNGPVPDKAIRVGIMNGTRDRLMPFDGGAMAKGRGAVLSTKGSFDYWAQANNCEGRPTRHRYENVSSKDRSRVIRTQHGRCSDGALVALFEVRGAGHSTPSSSERYRPGYLLLTGRQNWDIESAAELWAVFE